jgi:rubrerythrin
MSKRPVDLSALGTAKALALGCFGEDIAAYRYLILSEKADRPEDAREFRGMVAEEQSHRDGLQALLSKYYPDADYVLTAEEKQMVECGSRPLRITDRASFEEAVRTVIESERRTAAFYGQIEPHIAESEIRKTFRELAEEGVEHHSRLCQIAADNGIVLSESP